MSYELRGRSQKPEDRGQKIKVCLLSFVFCILYSAFSFAYSINSHKIDIDIDITAHRLTATDMLTIKSYHADSISLLLNESVKIAELRLNGNITKFEGGLKENPFLKKVYEVDIKMPENPPSSPFEKGGQGGLITLEIKYAITFDKKPEKPKFSREFISDETVGYIGEEGIFLSPSALWYPVVEGGKDFAYKINITSEKGYEYITAGDRIRREEKGDKITTSFQFLNPSEEIFLVGGKYIISESNYNDIKIYTYFSPKDEDLSDGYIESVKNYLKLYEGLLGKYPFGQFSVVSNFLPTGYGFPTFTLLGQEILRLPFIKDTSLGHEVLHNWWGNSVYVDYESGNWCEGLTTYLADHYYKEMKGEGINYRKEMLRGYNSYINEGNDFPLSDFKSRTETFTRAIGYNKSVFVFHMLRIELGDEKFFSALKEIIKRQSFKVTSWIDLQKIFEEVNGEPLGWFFKQWIEVPGAPFLNLKNAAYKKKGEGYITSFKLVQDGKPYLLNVSIEITTEKGKAKKIIRIKDKEESIEIRTADRPLSLSIDPHADIFRLLHKQETPPTISRVMGDKNKIIVLPTGGDKELIDTYKDISGAFLPPTPPFFEGGDKGGMKNDVDLTMEDIKNNALFIFGGLNENKLLERLLDKLPDGTLIEKNKVTINNKSYQGEGYFTVLTIPNKFNPDKAIMIIIGFDPNSIRITGSKLIHYGKYSYLAFKDGKNIDKGIWETKDSPLIVNLEKD
ncbi:MAG TPA: hypothetical protein DCQ99_00525 [Nitrospinae bacterium]|nr:hypothetical protein [Nitrospinota bacterium]HBA27349.1 hypothetical protein [Nitrospinota bacterium]